MGAFRVRIGKELLGFAAAHFITYGEQGLERLHGHNYRVAVELEGNLDDHSLVYDFVALRRDTAALLKELDHRVLLATGNPRLSTVETDGEVVVRHGERRYVFPASDVAFLSVPNTTAERLAELLAERLSRRIASRGVHNIRTVDVEVEEAAGQSARFVRPVQL